MSKYRIKERFEKIFNDPEGESVLEKFVRYNTEFYNKIGNSGEVAYTLSMFGDMVVATVDFGLPFEIRYAALCSLAGKLSHVGAFYPEGGLLSHIRRENRKH